MNSERAGGKVLVFERGDIREIRLNRPDLHNAFDEEVIAALTEAFAEVTRACRAASEPEPPAAQPPAATRPAPRAVLLTAAGKSFCAGADLNYMRRVASWSEDENLEDARKLAGLFRTIRECPVFVLGRIHGTALGGGTGLVACCDLAIASVEARFGFTEVRLGIVPAVISPFVLDRIGPAHGRALFPAGEIFGAAEALRIGLVDRVAAPDQLNGVIDAVLANVRAAAPGASREAKLLVARVAPRLPLPYPPLDTAMNGSARPEQTAPAALMFEDTARVIARLRSLPEAREGMAAFLEKRRPSWNREDPAPPSVSPGT